jgi:hypothetical protein
LRYPPGEFQVGLEDLAKCPDRKALQTAFGKWQRREIIPRLLNRRGQAKPPASRTQIDDQLLSLRLQAN